MELFQNTKDFPRQNLEYLKYRALVTRAPFKIGPKSKSNSLLSLVPQEEAIIYAPRLPEIVIREIPALNRGIENISNKRGSNSAPIAIEHTFQTNTKGQYMSKSANLPPRGDNNPREASPPFRVNQTVMYRTISASRHHRDCVPKKRTQNSTRNNESFHGYIPPPPQTAGNRSIGFDLCQDGHLIFPNATRRHFRSRGRPTCDFCESFNSIDWYCKNCNKNFCTLCKHTHEMSRGSFTSYRELMDRVFYQKTTLRHLAWRINDIKYQYENEMREKMVQPNKK